MSSGTNVLACRLTSVAQSSNHTPAIGVGEIIWTVIRRRAASDVAILKCDGEIIWSDYADASLRIDSNF
jgi:hypothetical protein